MQRRVQHCSATSNLHVLLDLQSTLVECRHRPPAVAAAEVRQADSLLFRVQACRLRSRLPCWLWTRTAAFASAPCSR